MLKIKSQNASPLRSRKMPEKQQIFEANVTAAANFFLKNNFLPPDMRKYASSTARSKKPYRKPVNLKQYAVMSTHTLSIRMKWNSTIVPIQMHLMIPTQIKQDNRHSA
ncbi:MAG: hypothetical protein ACLUAR_20145 [Pilosibacter sp.]